MNCKKATHALGAIGLAGLLLTAGYGLRGLQDKTTASTGGGTTTPSSRTGATSSPGEVRPDRERRPGQSKADDKKSPDPEALRRVQEEFVAALDLPPTAARQKQLILLAQQLPLSVLLGDPSPLDPSKLTDDDLRAVASVIDNHLRWSTDAEALTLAKASAGSPVFASIAGGMADYLLKNMDAGKAWSTISNWEVDPAKQKLVLDKLAAKIGHDRPEEFAALLKSSPDGKMLEAYGQTFVRAWSSKDPQAATAWAYQGPPDQPAPLAKSAFASWCVSDPYSASEWLRALPAGDKRDHVAVELVKYLTLRKDNEAAKEWADSIQNPDLKAKMAKVFEPQVSKKKQEKPR